MAEDHRNVHVIKDAAALDGKLKEAQNVKNFDIKAKWVVNDLPTYVFIMSGEIIDKATHGDKLAQLEDMIDVYSSITDFAYE